MKKLFFALVLTFFAQVDLTFASPYPKTVNPYFEGNVIKPTALEQPFAPDSPEKQKELSEIIELQKGIHPQDLDLAKYDYGITSEKFIKAVDPVLKREHFPALYNLLMRVRVTSQETKDQIKDYWKSARPYQVSKDVKMFTEPSFNNSYPSGHATKCYALAEVIGMLIPEEKDLFFAEAKKISHLRILTGEHFPSDLVAGQKKLAEIIVEKLQTNSEFQKDFAAAKEELSRDYPLRKAGK